MRTVLGIAAIFVGIPLVCVGIYGLSVGIGISHAEPEFGNGIAGYGAMAVLFGILLCFAAWIWSKLDDKK